MIRRAATWNQGTVAAPALLTGWVLGWMLRIDANGNQTMVISFESANNGQIFEVPETLIAFTDGQPANIPVIS